MQRRCLFCLPCPFALHSLLTLEWWPRGGWTSCTFPFLISPSAQSAFSLCSTRLLICFPDNCLFKVQSKHFFPGKFHFWSPLHSSARSFLTALFHFQWHQEHHSYLIRIYSTLKVLVIQSYPTLWDTCQASLSMEFSRQEYWSGLPFPSPGDLPIPGIKPRSSALHADSCIAGRFFTVWAINTVVHLFKWLVSFSAR